MAQHKYKDVILEIKGRIGIIKFNRPEALNSFGGSLQIDTISAIRELNEHPDTIFTVLTGEGRFFSSGADVRGVASFDSAEPKSAAETKVAFMERFAPSLELVRSIIDHKKVFVLALNGPSVGAGAAWFQGSSDIVLAAEDAWIQVTFSAMGLTPENGSAINFAHSMGTHRANDILMFGERCSAQELKQYGLVNRIFPTKGFHESVVRFLETQLETNDGKSMMEVKRLQNAPKRAERMLAAFDAMEALAERFVEGAPAKRFAEKKAQLDAKSKGRSKL